MKTTDEEKMIKDIENGKYISMRKNDPKKFKAQKEKFENIAKNTISQITKKKAYTLKLYENDVNKIKILAMQKGLPYQTYIASILHQVATRQIKA